MKTAIELLKESQSITIDELLAIADCKRMTKDVYTSRDMLTAHEIVSLLAFRELEKALKTDDYQLILDCNYANSKSDDVRLFLYRYDIESAHVQIYAKVKKESIAFDVCTSCKAEHRNAFAERVDTMKFVTQYDKAHNAKTSVRKQVAYDELVDVIKSLIALFYEVNNKSATESTESEQSATESAQSTETATATESTETKTESTETKKATKRRKKKASATETATESTTETATESAETATA